MEKFESLEDVKAHVISGIEDCVEYVIRYASNYNGEIEEVLECDTEDLPKYLNSGSPAVIEIVKSRLNGSPIKDFDPFLQVLFDADMGYEEYKELGMNDGALQTFSTMADRLGMDEESKRAASAVYSWD